MTTAGDGIDWSAAHEQLARARRALEAPDVRSTEEAARVLAQRARALALPKATPVAPAERLELLVFTVCGERYGAPSASVLDVLRLRGVTRVPGTPAAVAGVVTHRGRILTVLDLCTLLELPGGAGAPHERIVAVEAGGTSYGLLAQSVEGFAQVGADLTPPAPDDVHRFGFVRGATADMVAVLDLEALLRDPRVIVDEEAE